MEKIGVFSVRSAYNLALKLANLDNNQTTSREPNRERKLWTRIWEGRVPPKVNVFVWKLAKYILPTRRAKFVRKMEVGDCCQLCDREPETSFHATASCPQVYGLRQAMREFWMLPDEEKFAYCGPDWFLLLLDRCSPE